MTRFTVSGDDFLLDGEPFRILSGSIHYFRVHPDQWRGRIRRAREMGLNTIETYVAWNAHAPRAGEFHCDGGLDLGRFLDAVAAEGMFAIVRPGPYICAEWNNGGLPAWVFADGAGVRRLEDGFMAHVRTYYDQLAKILVSRQIDRGGPIIVVQVENEYGAYGNDPAYIRAIAQMTRDIGITTVLTTVDQPAGTMLEDGSVPELLATASFGSRSPERLARLREHQRTGPLMVSEYWDGWFDSWGEYHHVTNAEESAADLDQLLAAGASVNLYMFHGGTNFGFSNGANDKGRYIPITTSYDYDAPLNETGLPTEKYWRYREVISRRAPVPELAVPDLVEPAPVIDITAVATVSLWDVLDLMGEAHSTDHVPTTDEFAHYDGFSLYRYDASLRHSAVLSFAEVRDRAQVFIDRAPVGVIERDNGHPVMGLPGRGTLELLVEDMGRVDYGPRLGEPTGLIGPARIGADPADAWTITPLSFDRLDDIVERAERYEGPYVDGPVFVTATFDTPAPERDHFLDTAGWSRGTVWINGFHLGRYWSRGPQQTLYVPAPVLRAEGNTIVMFETGAARCSLRFVAEHLTGDPET